MFHKGVLKSNMFILSRFFCWKFVIFYFQQECEIMLEGPQTQCILIFLLIQNWNFDSRENFRFPPISPPTLLKHLQTSYGWCEILGRKGCASNEQRGSSEEWNSADSSSQSNVCKFQKTKNTLEKIF